MKLPERKSPRADFHDYSGGDYFITICTREMCHYFGQIKNNEMVLSPLGKYAEEQLENLSEHYPYVCAPIFVVMPNHIHAIVSVTEKDIRKQENEPKERSILSVVVGGFKSAVTRYARRNNIDFGWQSRYHDHIIRDTSDGNHINRYIANNVAAWDADCFNQ